MNAPGLTSEFANVDTASTDFIAYLDFVRTLPAIERTTKLAFDALTLGDGGSLLDVGCGVGTVTAMLRSAALAHAQVLGIDKSAAMIAEARQRHSAIEGLRFEQRDGTQIEPNAYDGIWVERLLMHVPSPRDVVSAVVGGLRVGGRAVFIEPEWSCLELLGPSTSVFARWREHFSTRQLNGYVNRELPAWVQAAGGEVLNIESVGFTCRTLAEFRRLLNLDRIVASAVTDQVLTSAAGGAFIEGVTASARETPLVAHWPVFVTTISGTTRARSAVSES